MIATLLAAGLALNDAALAVGGTPKTLDGHVSVRMESEKIVLRIGQQGTVADCRFVFVNDGPTCQVKMGFPDNGYGAADPEEEADPDVASKPPKTGAMKSFQSWVDGKEVATRLERGQGAGEYWHTKTVTFKGQARTVVRDRYSLDVSSAIVLFGENKDANAHYAGYVVSTGASWKGQIGRSEVVFELPSTVKRIVTIASVTAKDDPRHYVVAPFAKGTVAYSGMAQPTVKGHTLRFVRTRWRPTTHDDISLWFDYSIAKD